jgi:hypothetical protein
MIEVLVWLLVTGSPATAGAQAYSPPMASLEQCQILQKASENLHNRSRCIEVKILVYK